MLIKYTGKYVNIYFIMKITYAYVYMRMYVCVCIYMTTFMPIK